MVRRQLFVVVLALASLGLVGCKDSLLDRSLIFSTHTTLGVEVSASPAESSEPLKLIIGYKRSEGVINPIYHSKGIETADEEDTTTLNTGHSETKTTTAKGRRPRYREQAYSVIAKFSGDAGTSAKGAAEGKISVAQWFATGEAAKTLASQPGIAGAVTGSSEIARAAAEEESRMTTFRGKHRTSVFSLLMEMYKVLDNISKDVSNPALQTQASEIKTSLISSRVLDEINYSDFDRYDYDDQQGSIAKVPPVEAPPGFYKAISYRQELNGSINDLKKALADPQLKENGQNVGPVRRNELLNELLAQKNRLEELDDALLHDDAVVRFIQFFFGN